MARAAETILRAEAGRLSQVLDMYPTWDLHLTGHSLGAGVASLMCHCLHTVPELRAVVGVGGQRRVSCTGFATPPVVTSELAAAMAGYVTTVVYQVRSTRWAHQPAPACMHWGHACIMHAHVRMHAASLQAGGF